VTGELVGFICPPQTILGSDLQDRCNEIATEILGSGDISGALAGLQAMAPEENSAVQTTEVDASQSRTEDLRERLEERRTEEDEDDDNDSAFNITVDGRRLTAAEVLGTEQGGGASADTVGSGRWGAFINGNFGIGDKDSTPNETGFDLDSYGVTGGVDYRFDQALLGLAVGYTTQDADLDANSGNLDTDGISVSLYGSYYPSPQSYVNAIVSYGNTNHDQERNIIYTITSFLGTTVVNQTALSETDSDEIAGSLEGGYDFYRGQWTLTPYARLDVAHTEIDGYTEQMANPAAAGSGLALQIDDQDFTSVTTAFGGRVVTVVNANSFDLFPQVGAEYVHEFENDNEDTRGRLVDDRSGSTFLLPTDDPDRDYGSVTAAMTADFRNGWYGHVLYQGLIGYSDLSVHAFEVGARLQF
jgi:uncharacterized protein YhjY with autotransporter beta-barrel domain